MKFIQPVLFVDPYWEKKVLLMALNNAIYDFDVLCNFNYQKRNFELLLKYIDINLVDRMSFGKTLEETVDLINSSRHELVDYFKYFLISYLKIHKKYEESSFHDYITNIQQGWQSYIKIIKKLNILRLSDLKRGYNTIVFCPHPDDVNRHLYNRIYNFIPNYYERGETWNLALLYLMDGGFADFRLVPNLYYSHIEYIMDDNYEEIEELLYKKLEKGKVSLPVVRFGL